MAQTVSIAHAKNHLPALIHAVENGEPVHLTRRGTPVAVLVSAEEFSRLRPDRSETFADALAQWRAETGGVDLPADFADQLRDRTYFGREVEIADDLSA